jgi:1-phosphofructokinase family hexose kinase
VRSLQQEGIAADFVQTREESRVCIAIIDSLTNTQTELNEIGPRIAPREIALLKRKIQSLLAETDFDFVTLSGSIPPGAPDTIYADLIEIARQRGVRCALDASGAALTIGLKARPWMAKPNIHELTAALGREIQGREAIAQAAQEIARTGIEIVIVTLGREGCVCATQKTAWYAVPPEIEFVSAVGSGDSFLGAFLWGVLQRRDTPEALRLAVGAGAANAAVYGAGFCTAEQIFQLANRTEIGSLELR